MIGDAYFHLRAQIGTSLFSLAKLARDLAAPEEALSSLQELQSELRSPILFVTLGESGAGKSALLNALLAATLRAIPPSPGAPPCFGTPMKPSIRPSWRSSWKPGAPISSSRDFTILDAAGFGSPAATPALLQQFVPGADVVIFVFPPQGECAAAWDFLHHADREHLQRFIFVVQQADAVEGDDLMNSVLGIHDRLRALLGEPRPIFAVSAQTRAGLEPLERYLDQEVIGNPARFAKLREICVSADALLFQLGAETRAAAAAAERKATFAEEQRGVLEFSRDEALRTLDRDLWSLSQLFDAAQRRGDELLARRISHHSLWGKDTAWSEAFHREVETRVREGLHRHAALTAEHCDATLRSVWDAQRAELASCGSPALAAFPADAAAQTTRLQAGIAETDPEGATTAAVLARLRRRRVLLRLPLLILVASTLGLIAAWVTGRHLLPAASLFTCAFVATVAVPSLLRGSMTTTLQIAMRMRREAILGRIEAEIRAEIDRVFGQLHASLGPLARAGAEERTATAPLLSRILQLAEHFDRSIGEIESYEARAAATEAEVSETPA